MKRARQADEKLTRRAFVMSALWLGCAVGLVRGIGGVAAAANEPPFIIKPNPPQPGKDLEVSYLGGNRDDVYYQVGDGPRKKAKGTGRTFTIPGSELKPGAELIIIDESDGSVLSTVIRSK